MVSASGSCTLSTCVKTVQILATLSIFNDIINEDPDNKPCFIHSIIIYNSIFPSFKTIRYVFGLCDDIFYVLPVLNIVCFSNEFRRSDTR